MPPFGPLPRRRLITALRQLGVEGPISRRKHQVMKKGELTILIPNPHGGVIGVGLLSRILRQAGVSREEWESV
jgi:hypothetical protein